MQRPKQDLPRRLDRPRHALRAAHGRALDGDGPRALVLRPCLDQGLRLLDFLDPQQHRDWARHRVLEVEGGTTGHRYLLAHRHSAHARRWGRICFDADDAGVLHFHDNSHPPEEEVLGAMLQLRHRESWLRNEASCFAGSFRHVLKNPFGDILDGTRDAAFTQYLGAGIAALMVQEGVAPQAVRAMYERELERDLGAVARLVDGTGRPRIYG
jgi:hypothetical protein